MAGYRQPQRGRYRRASTYERLALRGRQILLAVEVAMGIAVLVAAIVLIRGVARILRKIADAGSFNGPDSTWLWRLAVAGVVVGLLCALLRLVVARNPP